ncbi:DUF3267 domain-containing protein, partial [bacterium]|nr:DUF3267 domain-containing protein [bacterium]
ICWFSWHQHVWLAFGTVQWLRHALDRNLSQFVERPAAGGFVLTIPVDWLLGLLVGLVAIIPLHELIHGFFFWLFTGKSPRYGFNLLYAYAALPPQTYLCRNPYLIVTVAPLILITLITLIGIMLSPAFLVPTFVLVFVLNTVGSVGDVGVFFWLMGRPSSVYVEDVGDRMVVYAARCSDNDSLKH